MLCALIVAGFLACVALIALVRSCQPVRQSLSPNDPTVLSYQQNTLRGGGSEWRALSDEERHGFIQLWWSVREQYGDNPRAAVQYADLLISDLMEDCGCSLSLDHRPKPAYGDGQLTSKFCAAHQLTLHIQQGRFTKDELEHAMSLYAVLLDELLG